MLCDTGGMETTSHIPAARYSTAEVAARLFCSYAQTREILRAACIPHTKVGNAYLWDGAAVERLIRVLRREEGGEL